MGKQKCAMALCPVLTQRADCLLLCCWCYFPEPTLVFFWRLNIYFTSGLFITTWRRHCSKLVSCGHSVKRALSRTDILVTTEKPLCKFLLNNKDTWIIFITFLNALLFHNMWSSKGTEPQQTVFCCNRNTSYAVTLSALAMSSLFLLLPSCFFCL